MAKRKENGGPISDKLRAAIRESNLSIYALGRASGVSHPIIIRFMARQRDIRLETLDRLAPHLGLELVQKKLAK